MIMFDMKNDVWQHILWRKRFTLGLSTCVLQTVQVKKRVYENIFDENMIYCSQVSKVMIYSLAHCAIFFYFLTACMRDVCLHFTAAYMW